MKARLDLIVDGKRFASRELASFVTEEWLRKELRPTGVTLEQCEMVVEKDGTRIRIHSLNDILKY